MSILPTCREKRDSNSGCRQGQLNILRPHVIFLSLLQVVQELVRNNADVDEADTLGNTAMIFAAMGGHCDVMHELLDHGSSAKEIDVDRCNALMYACQGGHSDITQLLLNNQAVNENIHQVDSLGRNALFMAAEVVDGMAQPTRATCAKVLMAKVPDEELSKMINVVTKSGDTALTSTEGRIRYLLFDHFHMDKPTLKGTPPDTRLDFFLLLFLPQNFFTPFFNF